MKINVAGKRALVRVDFNVPLNKKHEITDDTRMSKALPTINKLLDEGASVVLMSHLGRPQKKLMEDGSIDVKKFTLRHIAPHLSNLLDRPVKFADSCIGEEVVMKARALQSGEVLLVENTRFHKGEAKGDSEFAAELSKLGEVYINDAFGTAHRAHASTTVVADSFDASSKDFGLLMAAEVENANKVLHNPDRPLVAITGGAKVSDKLLLLEKLIDFADTVIIGGGMAYTFFKAQGGSIGDSICEDDKLDLAIQLMEMAKQKNTTLLLPTDNIAADKFSNDANRQTVDSMSIPDGWEGLDIGPKSVELFSSAIKGAKTIIWNGPMGVFEFDNFAAGTNAIAQAVADSTAAGAFSLIGGGDSVAAITKNGLDDQVSHVSTGGGAMLEYLEGKKLPGIQAITG
ncbi:MAG: phosphoglycerate kinase [Bacteroidota bacterium]